jgi:hypothetical protein
LQITECYGFTGFNPTLTAEVLTTDGWEIIGPSLPEGFYHFCLVNINETTILVTG